MAGGGEIGTITGVFNGVQNPQQKYAVISSHVSNNGKVRCQGLGRFFKDAGCGTVFFEGTAYEVGASANQSIAGLGIPKGIQRPVIGMQCISNSCTSGKINGKVTMINFDAPQAVTLSMSGKSCRISIHDMYQSKPCPTHGDSANNPSTLGRKAVIRNYMIGSDIRNDKWYVWQTCLRLV
jgi:hypothetical protein